MFFLIKIDFVFLIDYYIFFFNFYIRVDTPSNIDLLNGNVTLGFFFL